MGILQNINSDKFHSDEYHGGDYWRFTPQGVVELFPPEKFKKLELLLISKGGIAFYGEKK